ncbi:hypothetical protein D3C78_17960 [compost metagenome]
MTKLLTLHSCSNGQMAAGSIYLEDDLFYDAPETVKKGVFSMRKHMALSRIKPLLQVQVYADRSITSYVEGVRTPGYDISPVVAYITGIIKFACEEAGWKIGEHRPDGVIWGFYTVMAPQHSDHLEI